MLPGDTSPILRDDPSSSLPDAPPSSLRDDDRLLWLEDSLVDDARAYAVGGALRRLLRSRVLDESPLLGSRRLDSRLSLGCSSSALLKREGLTVEERCSRLESVGGSVSRPTEELRRLLLRLMLDPKCRLELMPVSVIAEAAVSPTV